MVSHPDWLSLDAGETVVWRGAPRVRRVLPRPSRRRSGSLSSWPVRPSPSGPRRCRRWFPSARPSFSPCRR
ncbi:hypothetical protein ACFQL0_08740 [Haloplanus litoreus]|uniref:hypothetical protein n=1 Tax=Haloplanus litoreus TaxID=767515 RepID=UPI00361D0395